MPSPATSRRADPDAQFVAQHARIARLEAALWDGGFNATRLPAYQAAWRELEALIAGRGDDTRHAFVLVIPVADSPTQLRRCLASLLELCRLYGYGGMADGTFRKVSVMVADDSEDDTLIAAHRAIVDEYRAHGLPMRHFGLDEQRALLDSLAGTNLASIIDKAPSDPFGHKGQAVTRNLAYLALAREAADGAQRLVYTLDADQQFQVKVESATGDGCVYAVNFFAQLDAIFSVHDVDVLTGKVVGDPPVSPAVMAGNFLDDVAAFLVEIAASHPDAPYRVDAGTPGSADAAYHDMAGLFGFDRPAAAYRYRCASLDAPSHAEAFSDFARHLKSFFHGEHPTRITWYRHAPALASVAPARTVYTGNYVFRPEALRWFIPFAPLRLRMSGPTLGRLMKAELGARFVSANLPMLHARTVETGAAEFRPGVVDAGDAVDLGDEFERQFYGDVMLFGVERLTALGFPATVLPAATVAATFDTVHAEIRVRYAERQREVVARLDELTARFDAPGWWHAPQHAEAVAQFRAFFASMAHNFGRASPVHARLADDANWPRWRARLVAAVTGLHRDRDTWDAALARLAP